jgi:hypothetical protein
MSEQAYGIDASDFRAAIRATESGAFPKVASKPVHATMRALANAVRRHVRGRLKPHRRTGKMASNVRVRFRGYGLNAMAGVRAVGSGGNLIAGGVQPHRIEPGRIMPLYEGRGRSAGITGFARAVEHPGFAADPFFDKGVQDAAPEINALLQGTVDAIAERMAAAMEGKA